MVFILNSSATQANFHQLLTWFLSNKSQYLDAEGPWVVNMMAKNIAFTYENLPAFSKKLTASFVNIPKIKKQDYKSKDACYLQSILGLQDYVGSNLNEYVVDFLIHGSLSTLDYSMGWSDLDTLVIVRNDTIKNPFALIAFRKKLSEAQKYLFEIDPLQHHGFIYCTEFELEHYLEYCMPLEVLEESKSLLRSSTLQIKHDRSNTLTSNFFAQKTTTLEKAYKDGVLRHHQYEGKYLLDNYQDMDVMYQMKYFLSVVMSLPIFYLDAIGEPSYKKDSFQKLKPLFVNDWEIMESASRVREEWAEHEEHPYVGNSIPEWLPGELGQNYFERAYKLSNVMLNELKSTIKKQLDGRHIKVAGVSNFNSN